jgi:DNA-binding transcriptional MerR regulator
METEHYLSTSELGRAAGVGRETLRFYEEEGLIRPTSRSAAGYRRFGRTAVETIAFIKQTQQAGFSLREIKNLLNLRSGEQDTCGALSGVLTDKLNELDAELRTLEERRAALVSLSKTCSQQNSNRICGFVRQGPGCC